MSLVLHVIDSNQDRIISAQWISQRVPIPPQLRNSSYRSNPLWRWQHCWVCKRCYACAVAMRPTGWFAVWFLNRDYVDRRDVHQLQDHPISTKHKTKLCSFLKQLSTYTHRWFDNIWAESKPHMQSTDNMSTSPVAVSAFYERSIGKYSHCFHNWNMWSICNLSQGHRRIWYSWCQASIVHIIRCGLWFILIDFLSNRLFCIKFYSWILLSCLHDTHKWFKQGVKVDKLFKSWYVHNWPYVTREPG